MLCSLVVSAWAEDRPARASEPAVELALSVLDVPGNTQFGPRAPSMHQATELANDTYELGFGGLRLLTRVAIPGDRPLVEDVATWGLGLAFVTLTADLPLPFATWMHEEYHRDALAMGGVRSTNGSAWLHFGPHGGTVYEVDDDDLVRLKAEDGPAYRRAQTAGIEGQNQLVLAALDLDLLRRDEVTKGPLVLWNAWYDWNYFRLAAGPVSDDVTDWNLEHQGGELERDFVGLDLTAWAYDLHRPDEPYADRGPHPSGDGIKRAIGWSDLTEAEQAFLVREKYLSLLNFASPAAFGLHHVQVGEWGVNLALQHTPAPYGSVIHAHVYLRQPRSAFRVSLGLQRDLVAAFPSVEVVAADRPLPLGARTLRFSPRLAAWTQPEDLDAYSPVHVPGGLAAVTADVPVLPGDAASATVAVSATVLVKSTGWVPGEESLRPGAAARLGARVRF